MKKFNIIKKITKNLFIISGETGLLLFDYRKRKYFSTIQIKNNENNIKEIHDVCNVNKRAILLSYEECISYITIDDDDNFNTIETIKNIFAGSYKMAVTMDGQLIYCGPCREIQMKYKTTDKDNIDMNKKVVSDNEEEGDNDNEEDDNENEEDQEES